MLSFLANFGKAKVNQIGQGIMQAIVRFDPETASEAQIAEFEQQLDELTQRVAALRREYDTAHSQADAAEANYNRYLGAAEKLEAQFKDPALADKRADIEKSLTGLLATLETLKPQVAAGKKEAAESKSFLDEFEQAAKDAATKVTTARQRLQAAKHDMERAALERERAEERSEHAAALAGIRKGSDSLGTALDAMTGAAQKDRDAATASGLKADLLTQNTPKAIGDDPLVREALGESVGATPASLTDRLAALKNPV